MSEDKFVTKVDCLKSSNKILNKLNDIEKQNGELDVMLKGDFGMVAVVKKMQKDVEGNGKLLIDIKKNGHISGKAKTAIYSSIIITVGTVLVALITWASTLRG